MGATVASDYYYYYYYYDESQQFSFYRIPKLL